MGTRVRLWGGGLLASCGEVTLVLAEPFVVALVRGLGLGLGILPYLGDHTPFGVLLDTFHLPLHHHHPIFPSLFPL